MFKNLPILFILTVLALNTYVSAQPELDPTYNSSGMFVLTATWTGTMGDIIVQPDNKIIAVGSCFNNGPPFGQFPLCVMRANENGTFDTTFGGTGRVFTNIPGSGSARLDEPTGLALQNDGKIIAVGTAVTAQNDRLMIARYNSDGSLDSAFGTNGIVQATITGNSLGIKVLVQPDGKIVALAAAGTSSSAQYIFRYLTNGTIDTTFGNGGIVQLSASGNSYGSKISLQPDGKILVGGAGSVTRLNRDGALDTTFDGDGIVTIISGTDIVSVNVQSDGKILALGINNIIYRFNSDGSVDTSFDDDGSRSALNGTSEPYDLLVTPSGKINVVGQPTIAGNFPNIYFRYARYLPNGAPDTSFSDDGFLDVNFSEYTVEGATGVTIDRKGRLVTGGRASSGSIMNAPWNLPQFATTRFIASPASNAGFSGRVTEANGRAVANAYLTLKNGSEVIGYARTNPFGYFHFASVPTNITYTLSTVSKGLNFYDRNVLVDGAIENYLVVGGNQESGF